MGLLNVAALWLAWAIPALIALYLLKLKRREHVVPSILFWQHMLRDTRANAPFQRLRRNLLLLLQLLALAALLAALARPFLRTQQGAVRHRIVVLDATASMQGRDVQPSRFEAGRAQVARLIEGMREREELMLIHAGSRTRIAASFSSDRSLLRAALERMQVEDAAGDLAEAAVLAVSVAKTQADCEILLFSDGSGVDLSSVQTGGVPAQFIRLGTGSRNVGLTALDVRTGRGLDRRAQVYAAARNFSAEEQRFDLSFHLDGELVDVQPLVLPPGGEAGRLLQRPAYTQGILEVRLDIDDDLAVDNRAWAVLMPGRTLRVLLCSRTGNPYLERVLLLDPRVEVTRIEPAAYRPDMAGFDVHVLEGFSPGAPPAANALLINALVQEWSSATQNVARPFIVDWDRQHPVTRFCQFDEVGIVEGMVSEPPPWAQRLLEVREGALAWAGQQDLRRVVSLGFDPLKSNWPLRVSFIIFIENTLGWMDVMAQEETARQLAAGQVAQLRSAGGAGSLAVIAPDGERREVEAGPGGTALYADTARTGVYQVEGMAEPFRFCVNLLDRRESDIRPGEEIAFGRYERLEAGILQPAEREIWKWLVAAAVAVLMLEWWVYHRRSWI